MVVGRGTVDHPTHEVPGSETWPCDHRPMNDDLALIEEFPPTAEGRLMTDFAFVERAGLEILHVERGRVVLRLPLEPHVNHVGISYAGALFTLAEVPGGVLFMSAFDVTRFYPVVGEVNIRFTAPTRGPALVDARMSEEEIERVASDLESSGKARWVLSHSLFDEEGNQVATAEGTYFGLAF